MQWHSNSKLRNVGPFRQSFSSSQYKETTDLPYLSSSVDWRSAVALACIHPSRGKRKELSYITGGNASNFCEVIWKSRLQERGRCHVADAQALAPVSFAIP